MESLHPAPIIIVGHPRSGTGLVAQFFKIFGIYMGGYLTTDNHESIVFKDLNRQILDGFGCTWRNVKFLPTIRQMTKHCNWVVKAHKDSMFITVLEQSFFDNDSTYTGRWGWKDPRSSLTLPIWSRLFPEAEVIHVQRNAGDVALSNVVHDWSRESYDPYYHELGERCAWYQHYKELNDFYNKRIEESSDLFDTYYQIDYEDILADPLAEITELADFFGFPLELAEKAAELVDHSRRGRYERLAKNGVDLSFTKEEE
jgi:hypothetical protein